MFSNTVEMKKKKQRVRKPRVLENKEIKVFVGIGRSPNLNLNHISRVGRS